MPAEREPPITYRQRIALAATLCVIAICALTCSSCVRMYARSSPVDQYNGTVKIFMTCVEPAQDGALALSTYGGSGIVVSPDLALTAAHVVTCPNGILAELKLDAEYGVAPLDVEVETLLPGADIARIRVVEHGALSRYFRPITIGPRPEIGDTGCESSAVPRLTYRCGTINPSPATGPILVDLFTEHGNSGSGFWVDGRLVGLVVTAGQCQYGVGCVGGVTPLQDHRDLIPVLP